MQGFKSFADPVTIELNDGITCVVGPNGSGKSNISDALRWVIGEQSPRMLRGGKMEEVIFAGTATRKPKNMAEVTLTIDNSSGILPIEYNEVAVTRRMYRSGESEYLINNNPCRLRDIKELFMDTGIGVDGYSIIGQGKIVDIVSTKPENRREIFEESAGVVLYKTRKSEAERKLKSASDDLERVRDIIAEIEDRIGGLKIDSEKAEEYISLRDKYKMLAVNIILHNVASLEKNISGEKDELDELTARYENSLIEREKLEDELESFRITESELSEKHEEKNNTLVEKIEELHMISNRGQINSERLQSIENELARLANLIKDTEGKLDSERSGYAELEAKEKTYDEELAKTKKELEESTVNLNSHAKKADIARNAIEKNKNTIIELNNRAVAHRAEIKTLEAYSEKLNERKEQLRAEHENRDETDMANRRKLKELDIAYREKEEAGRKVMDRINMLAGDLSSTAETLDVLNHKIQDTAIEVNRLTARKSTIEEMENNYEGYNNAVKLLMKENFRGITGPVSDLITVPAGYELAVETALGGQLQNIVCDDDKAAEQAINWLKSSKSGRATFLPVSSVQGSEYNVPSAILQSAGYISLASEKVQTDCDYDSIRKYLLGRVILADNMDNAIRMSKLLSGGCRIVTLDGEVVSASGAITGGRYRNRTANLLARKKEIGELELAIEKLKKHLLSAKENKETAEKSIRAFKEERAELYETARKLEVELSIIKSDRDHAGSIAEAAEDADGKYHLESKTIEDDMERALKMIADYRQSVDEAEKEIEKLECETESMLSDASRYDAMLDEENEDVVKLKVAVNEHETKILGLNELIERVRDSVYDLENSVSEAEDKVDELTKQRDILTGTGAESGEKEEKLKSERHQIEEEIASIAAKLEENKVMYEKSLKRQSESAEMVQRLQDSKYKLEIKSARNETLLETQKDKLWDEFEMSYAEALELKEDSFMITSGNKEAKDIKLRMSELGDVNISAIEEYKAVSKRYEFMTKQEQDIAKAMTELRDIILNMDKTIKEKFKDNFDRVVINFEQSFKELFGGGTAELRLEDESDPLESGIEIIAQPPGKKLKNINLMSGGEKTLTAIALMFAVLKAKPTPFCILDEVEAALDEANIERFSNYLRNFSDVQFALITHQKATMEHADVLYGITMPEQGISKLLSLKLGEDFDADEYTN